MKPEDLKELISQGVKQPTMTVKDLKSSEKLKKDQLAGLRELRRLRKEGAPEIALKRRRQALDRINQKLKSLNEK